MNDKRDVFPFAPIVQLAIVAVLAGVSFYAGSLWKGKDAESVPETVAEAVPTQAAVPTEATTSLSDLAVSIGLNKEAFQACLNSGEMTEAVKKEMAEGSAAGVSGTPGNIIYDNTTGRAFLISGAYPLATFTTALADIKNGVYPPKIDAQGNAAEELTGVKAISDTDYVKGDKKARFTLIEYSDYECPFCQRFHPTAASFTQENSDVSWVFRQYPLNFHATAQKSAEAAECAGKLGGADAFWKYTDARYALSANPSLN